jgi:hypothetical protein
MLSLLYISISEVPRDDVEDVLQEIIDVAVRRNLSSGVTGALAHIGRYFAQVLEGSAEAVQAVLDDIRSDSRHRDLRVVRAGEQSERRFSHWGMTLVWPGPETHDLVERCHQGEQGLSEALVDAMERSADPAF